MKIKELINEMEYEILAGSEETEITTLVYDSRKVEKGSVFVCISGSVCVMHMSLFRMWQQREQRPLS